MSQCKPIFPSAEQKLAVLRLDMTEITLKDPEDVDLILATRTFALPEGGPPPTGSHASPKSRSFGPLLG